MQKLQKAIESSEGGQNCEDHEKDEDVNMKKDEDRRDKKVCERLRNMEKALEAVRVSIIHVLEKFTSLQSLSLCWKDAVDDEKMLFISKEFQFLQELEIKNCTKLTDAGITGKWGNKLLGPPISEIKD